METKSSMQGVQWQRGKILGSGGFGTVYEATTTSDVTNKIYSRIPPLMAVKTVDFSQSASLLKEAVVLNSLHVYSHVQAGCPYIIGYYGHDVSIECDDQKQKPYFNMFLELASHGTLSDQITQSSSGRLPESQVKSYTRAILLGLDHIHRRGYVHCDIKPDNILLASSSGVIVPKIADFGLAKPVGIPVKNDKDRVRGTPLYMAPESIASHEFEPQCDVWALGCVVLEMLTGKPAWKWDVDEPLLSLSEIIAYGDVLPDIPETLAVQAKDFIKKCLVKDPSQRWSLDMLLKHPFVAGVENLHLGDVNVDEADKSHKRPLEFQLRSPSFITLSPTSIDVPSRCIKRRKIGDVKEVQPLERLPSIIVL